MEHAVKIFTNERFGKLRVVIIDGEPYFVGKDVATALGYKNPREAIRYHVDTRDKREEKILLPSGVQKNYSHQQERCLFVDSRFATAQSKRISPLGDECYCFF